MKLIEDLWLHYQFEKSAKLTEEEKKMLSALNQKREAVTADMSENTLSLFEVYEDGINLMQCNREKQSFVQGVCFGIKLLTEALWKNT